MPKALRDAPRRTPGTKNDVFPGADNAARLVEVYGMRVVAGETTIDDQDVFRLLDAGRR